MALCVLAKAELWGLPKVMLFSVRRGRQDSLGTGLLVVQFNDTGMFFGGILPYTKYMRQVDSKISLSK